jgi:hypothetical protein
MRGVSRCQKKSDIVNSKFSLVLVFGVFGAVGPLALKRVILVYNQEKDQKVWWRVQGEFAQDLQVIIKFVN